MIDQPPPGSDPKQAARLRRLALALGVYGVMALLPYLAHVTGLIRAAPAFAGIAAMLAVNAGLFLVVSTGLNLRFPDPSLTWLQIFLASTILLFAVYQFDRERSFALMMCLAVFIFGAFRFNIRQFLILTAEFLAGFALVIYLLLRFKPEYADPHLLALEWVALATVLPCFAFIGGKLSELRQRLRSSNEELSSALATVQRADKELRESVERFHATFDHASVGIMHSSLDRRILVVNRKFCDMIGYSAEELQQGSVRKIHHPEDSDADQHLEKQLLAGEIENFSFEKRYIRKNGSVFWANRTVSLVRDNAGEPQYFIRVIEDISARKEAEEKLRHLAHFDPLTDLPNRAMFHDRLAQALVQARRRNERVGIMFLDLDRFKLVNDTLGHNMGDLLLQQVARRLSEAVRPGDTVGRLSGDEFAIILGDLRSAADAGLVAQKILKAFATPFRLANQEQRMTTSVGISLYPEDGDENDALLKAADSAMYAAKMRGRNCFEFFGAARSAGVATGEASLDPGRTRPID